MRGTTTARFAAITIALACAATMVTAAPAGAGATPCGYPITFRDVEPGHKFQTEIYWLANEGVINGWPDCTFRPTTATSRQAMAAFLERFELVDPAFVPPASPSFSDYPVGSVFYTEVEWLVDEGIAEGYPDGTFHPGESVSRQAMAAFMHRYAGAPAFVPPLVATFDDVPVGHTFYTEVEWLAAMGLTDGYADGGFHPTAIVSRQAIAAFLYRYEHDTALPRSIDVAAASPGALATGEPDADLNAGGSAAASTGEVEVGAAPASERAGAGAEPAAEASGGASGAVASVDAATPVDATAGAVVASEGDVAAGDEVALSITDAATENDTSSALALRGGAVALVAAALLVAATRRRQGIDG